MLLIMVTIHILRKTVWIVNIINNISQLDILEKEGLRMVGGNKFLGGSVWKDKSKFVEENLNT